MKSRSIENRLKPVSVNSLIPTKFKSQWRIDVTDFGKKKYVKVGVLLKIDVNRDFG